MISRGFGEQLIGIFDPTEHDHWPLRGQANEIGATGRRRDPLSPEYPCERSRIAVELALKVVSDPVCVGHNLGCALKLTAGSSHSDARISLDVAQPVS